MFKKDIPVFIDCEASSLSPESYPIEIAWGSVGGDIETYLINPFLYPSSYIDWSIQSEALHGLSRKYLKEHGVPPQFVVDRINNLLSKQKIYSDVPDFDEFWLGRLYESVGQEMTIVIGDALRLFEALEPEYFQYERKARIRAGGQHRAKHDVQYLLAMYDMCSK